MIQPAEAAALTDRGADDAEVAAVLASYIDLYTRETLEQWRALFLPGFTATATNEDGTVTTYDAQAFHGRQQALFASGKPVRETLGNTRVVRTGKLAFVGSDFTWTDGEARRDGRLMLLLVSERGRLRIQALTFSYFG
jgi:hypothetical protein